MISSYLEWLKIRDAVLADNHVELDIRKALSLAASCQHPDAIWLTEACRDKIVETEHELFEVCVALGDDDRAICFKWQLRGDEGCLEAELRRAAEVHNNAFAQALLARECEDQRKFELAKKSASQGERLGFLVLGQCFFDGEGCDENDEEATRNFLLAAKLGCVKGMIDFSEMLDSHDEKRWYWLSEAARNGLPSLFLSDFADEVEMFASGAGSARSVFFIGRALKGNINTATIFGESYNFEEREDAALAACKFYELQIRATKDAMLTWSLVGVRLKVVKDVRRMIARFVWDARDEARYALK